MRYRDKWPEYKEQWDRMVIVPRRMGEMQAAAQYAVDNKRRYTEIGSTVPWPLIAVIHKRESDAQDKHGNPLFTSYLGNGQPLNRRTTIVPKGRGPFASFAEGARDALKIDGLDLVIDWRLEKVLYNGELLNGAGYHMRGLPSAYIWGGTNIQKRGKFTSDGHWDAQHWDEQPGIAPILSWIKLLDPTVEYIRET